MFNFSKPPGAEKKAVTIWVDRSCINIKNAQNIELTADIKKSLISSQWRISDRRDGSIAISSPQYPKTEGLDKLMEEIIKVYEDAGLEVSRLGNDYYEE